MTAIMLEEIWPFFVWKAVKHVAGWQSIKYPGRYRGPVHGAETPLSVAHARFSRWAHFKADSLQEPVSMETVKNIRLPTKSPDMTILEPTAPVRHWLCPLRPKELWCVLFGEKTWNVSQILSRGYPRVVITIYPSMQSVKVLRSTLWPFSRKSWNNTSF